MYGVYKTQVRVRTRRAPAIQESPSYVTTVHLAKGALGHSLGGLLLLRTDGKGGKSSAICLSTKGNKGCQAVLGRPGLGQRTRTSE